MISNVVVLGMAGMAVAAYAPPPPTYGAETSSAPMAPPGYGASTAPVYAPVASSSAPAGPPAYEHPSSAAPTQPATYVTCSEATTLTWYSTTIPVPHPTVITLTHPAPVQTAPAYTAPPAPTHPAGDECAEKCNMDYDACRVAPDANMAQCASKYASCIGYNPFPDGHMVTAFTSATACSSTAAPTAPAPAPTHPAGPAGDECAEKCNMDYDACRVAPDANMASCASKYASCIGYNPFPDGHKVTAFTSATACSSTAAPTAPAYSQPPSPVNNQPPTYSAPAQGPPAPPAGTSPVSPVQPPTYTQPAQQPPSPVYPANNATKPAGTGSVPATTSTVTYQGAAAKVAVGAFTGFAAVLAFFL